MSFVQKEVTVNENEGPVQLFLLVTDPEGGMTCSYDSNFDISVMTRVGTASNAPLSANLCS